MLTVTFEQFLAFKPCWLEEKGGRERLSRYFANGTLSALNILKFDDVEILNRFWAVLREELIPAYILHEFGCRCAERVLSKATTPDPRNIEAVRVKRLWLKGKATDEELHAVWDNNMDFDRPTLLYWVTSSVARIAAWDTVLTAASVATRNGVGAAERQWQVEELIKMLAEVD